MADLAESELILNKDGSIYHLNLLPDQIADNVILVGDPERVEKVSQNFDHVELKLRKREFVTHTGTLNRKRISIISTGIGTDNIDIVINELDALANINFSDRTRRSKHRSLNIIRVGTSGAIQADIAVDSFLRSDLGLGFDSLMHYYQRTKDFQTLEAAVAAQLNLPSGISLPYVVSCDETLAAAFSGPEISGGFTGTNVGFYGPQGRVLRLPLRDPNLNQKMENFFYEGLRITNLEMETAGIYGLSELLGHRAISLNAIVANRKTGEFSKDSQQTIVRLIRYALERLVSI